jgi:uncharacterized protein YdbL (DUF1318 family)
VPSGRTLRTTLAAACLALLLAAPAVADRIDELKAAGQVGEQVDGYLGLVKDRGSAEAKALIQEINAKRRSAYADIARRNQVPLEAVAARAGQKLVAGAAPGEWVKDSTGSWKRR